VGKKTPMTLALFGFGTNGEVLDDTLLPTTLTADWLEDAANQGKPFPSYARLLAHRGTPEGESRYSWTIDFAGRRKMARETMQPYLEEAAQLKGDVVTLKEKLKVIKKSDTTKDVIETLESKIKETEKSARDAQAKADEIDAAVFDLKAVNPNVVTKMDKRTPEDIIGNIEVQGKVVTSALLRLKELLQGAF
jgi:type I restriction enzyme M protein